MTGLQDADIELGLPMNASLRMPADSGEMQTGHTKETKATRLSQIKSCFKCAHTSHSSPTETPQIEDYPAGYPRFTALIASHGSFQFCRRFLNLRTRLLLLKQDTLSSLEKRLEKIDRDESIFLRLGSSRSDDNAERNSVMAEIDVALADYDALIERNHRVLAFQAPTARETSNLQNWVDGTGMIAREETAYLTHSNDLLRVTFPDDNALMWLELWVEKAIIWFQNCFGQRIRRDVSRDPNVHIFPRASILRVARAILIPLIAILLLAPVIICNIVPSLTARLIIIIVSTTSFITILSSLTKARTVELAVAGATYTTVLIVFITSTDNSSSNQR